MMQTPYPQQAGYVAASPVPSTAYTHYSREYPADPRDPNAVHAAQELPPAPAASSSWFGFTNPSFITGLLVGTGATLMVTSPAVQNAVVKGAVSVWSAVVGGIEEVKERIRDAKAEKSQT
jgi:hypothetical protein